MSVAALSDLIAITALKNRYAAYCDDGYDADAIASLFVPDGVWESDGRGVHAGRDAIRTFMAGMSASFTWARHYMLNPIVRVDPDGHTASGDWLLYCAALVARDGREDAGVILHATYHDRFVKENGTWRFAHVKATGMMSTVVPGGWRPELALPDDGS